MTVIQFPDRKPQAPYDPQDPILTIHVYDNPGDAGFQWVSIADRPLTKEQMQDYLGDMFLSTLPAEPPGILQRAHTFFRNLFTPKDLK